jgi:hypothetical protein
MKIRWNEKALRLRITPAELESLRHRQAVVESLPFGAWQMILEANMPSTNLLARGTQMHFHLGKEDFERFLEPSAEGVYFERDGFRYFVEKDFPCEHPRPAEALESSQTFPRPEKPS